MTSGGAMQGSVRALKPVEVVAKTLLDYGLTLPALMLLAPGLAVIALCILRDSPGPIFYRRRVLGVGGREFDAFKFRTMFVDGDTLLAAQPEMLARLRSEHKLKDDPRVTHVGRWLRKYSLDELPQLLNVLLGDMSLVGPRMITAAESSKYGSFSATRMTVKPGLTGLWQVSGRSDISYADRVRLDMEYICDYSFWRDLEILFIRTVPAVLKGQGAY
jgi:lipopolysaccharide/colanic/teichoic acid biosynthesis glycosyltransferase